MLGRGSLTKGNPGLAGSEPITWGEVLEVGGRALLLIGISQGMLERNTAPNWQRDR